MPILKLVFGQINFFSEPFSLFEDEEAVKQGCQIGYVDLANNQTVAIFEIEVADSIIIERNRKGLRDIAAKYIKGTFSAALVFYYSKNQNEYRFSFIAQQSKIDEQTGVFTTVVTAPKRYTYVLGTPFCTTAADRWLKLAAEPEITIDKITDAFSVEKLSKDFFDQYKIQYTRFCKFIEADSALLPQFIDRSESNSDKAQKPLRDYVKKLLGRLVFLQFLQKKGWMGVPAANNDWKGGDLNFMANLFNKSPYQDNFLDAVLEPLFFNTLNAERTNDIAVDIDNTIKIPYLNGGLFEKTTLDDTRVQFPKHYFSELFEFFNQYNFTIDENDPDDAEVGIDPEMLGHIFENLLEDNKDKGAFYTPKEIVRYMCQESLIAYLHTHIPETLHPSVEKLIRTNIADECLQDNHNATLIQKLLVSVKICDPAIGSGAFPMGMLNEIFAVRRKLFGILGKNQSFSACLVKKEIIQNNIYGVDIEQGAVDIARLRFWLALVVDEDVPQALPNLDYKIMCGNSLISRFPLDAPIKDVFAEYNKKYKTNFTLQDYKNLVDEYTDVHNSKEQFRAKIEEIKGAFKSTLLNSDLVSRKKAEMEVLDYEMVDVFGERKADKDKKGYKAAKTKLEKYLKSEKDTLDNKLYVNSFEWRFEFPSLLDENGNFTGFDVVIGNPPYVKARDNNDKLSRLEIEKRFKTTYKMWDLFIPFIEQSLNVLNATGFSTMIIPDTIGIAEYTEKLIDLIETKNHLNQIVFFPNQYVFESASVRSKIICISKQKSKEPTKRIVFENSKFERIATVEGINKYLFEINKLNLSYNDCETLGKICYVSYGLRLNSEKEDPNKFQKKDLISDCETSINSRRYTEGKYIDRYKINKEYWLEWDTERCPKRLVRATFPELYQFDKLLLSRQKKVATLSKDGQICDNTIIISVPHFELRSVLNSNTKKYYSNLKEERNDLIEVSLDYSILYLLSILNSSLMKNYIHYLVKGRIDVYPDDWKAVPIKKLKKESQIVFEQIVEEILFLKQNNPQYDTTSLEQQIDLLVYKLYELSYEEVLLIEPDFGQRVSVEEYEKVVVE